MRGADLGYKYRCPMCDIGMNEGQQSDVYWYSRPLCPLCAPDLQRQRDADRQAHLDLRARHSSWWQRMWGR